jgi:tetratricopeptide (TPR) repeat protein
MRPDVTRSRSRYIEGRARRARAGILARALAGCLAGLGSLSAHPEATELLTALSHAIEAGEERPELFYAKALELRALGRIEEAIADLEQAVLRDKSSVPARKDLARLQATLGDYDRAAQTIAQAREVARAEAPRTLAGVLIVQAEVFLCQAKPRDALSACIDAFDVAVRIPPDWHVVRSRAERACGLHHEALETIKNSVAKAGAGTPILVDALIAAGQTSEALEIIECEIAAAPPNLQWLIKRAQARLPADPVHAAVDLDKAATMLNAAVAAGPPDASVLAQRALTRALLGQVNEAVRDLGAARRSGIDLMQILDIEEQVRRRSTRDRGAE